LNNIDNLQSAKEGVKPLRKNLAEYERIRRMALKKGYEGLEGAGTSKTYFIRLIHPSHPQTILGNNLQDTMKKVEMFLKEQEGLIGEK